MQGQWSALHMCEGLPVNLLESLRTCLMPDIVGGLESTNDLKVVGICSIVGAWLLAEARYCLIGAGLCDLDL